jgi:uncharacterized protein
VSNPTEIVNVSQQVQVTVVEVDAARKRIALSMKADPFAADAPRGGDRKPNTKAADDKRPRSSGANKSGGGQRRQGSDQQSSTTPEGDLQAKLAALKGKFK